SGPRGQTGLVAQTAPAAAEADAFGRRPVWRSGDGAVQLAGAIAACQDGNHTDAGRMTQQAHRLRPATAQDASAIAAIWNKAIEQTVATVATRLYDLPRMEALIA